MNKINLVIVLGFILTLLSCQNEKAEWDRTLKGNDIGEVNNFLKTHPKSKYHFDALEKLFELNKAYLFKKFITFNSYDTLIGKTTVITKMVRKDGGGFYFRSDPTIDAKGKTYLFYAAPSAKAVNVKIDDGAFADPINENCIIVGKIFSSNSLPAYDSLIARTNEIIEQTGSKKKLLAELSNKVAPFELDNVLNNARNYKDSLSNDILQEVFRFKLVTFEYDLILSLLIFSEKQDSYKHFIFPIYIEKLEVSENFLNSGY